MPTDREPTREEIDELLAFLPGFEEPGRSFHKVHPGRRNEETGIVTIGCIEYAEDVDAFYQLIHSPQWLCFGYQEQSPQELARDPERIQNAGIDEIRALLTWCVRGERFCDGHMATLFEKGVPQATLRRLAEIYDEP